MRVLLAKLKGPWLFVRYIEKFAKNHVRKNEGQLYFVVNVFQLYLAIGLSFLCDIVHGPF